MSYLHVLTTEYIVVHCSTNSGISLCVEGKSIVSGETAENERRII